MSLGQVNLSELFQFDELYWIPSEKVEVAAVHFEGVEVLVKKQEEKVLEPVAIQFPVISTTWVVIGQISEKERLILKQAFSAAPLSLKETDWSTLDLREFPSDFTAFIQNTQAKKYIFLGEHTENIKSQLPPNAYSEILDSKVLVFPRLISSLNESEKQLKVAFWNHLKAL
jgi:hypothetical protein